MRGLKAAALAASLLLAACAPRTAVTSAATPVVPVNALAAGVQLAAAMPVASQTAAQALTAFRKSCPRLVRREDASGLTRPEEWLPLCEEAERISPADAARFFATRFAWVEVGGGTAFATGYFEPEIAGCRRPRPGCTTPIYSLPPDLIRGQFSDASGEGRGRYDENGNFVLYHDRAAIDAGALAGRGLELAWAVDPVELFFLHIQGSGRVRMDDGSVLRIGYAGQNGRSYVAIGKLLRERGLMEPGTITMESLQAWLREDPVRGAALMAENPSYIFFRVLEGEGPLGALEVPVTGRTTVAADPKFVPLGAPVWLDMDSDVADGLWVAQDTGGAIKGANRFDTFWGAGSEARRIAGAMSSSGRALVLLPKSAAARAQARR
ncbi:murein transglycosylase A [Sphingomicrobium lutaoense]|uniref:peptidoglycan lytic exotransglycosylase n=1 Tax=Sphingomicrobium lutaoense TaxID=515949 RepID=A0A839Z2D2_9SPHN|nr:murein transglycosylase A [Sphingomicrobium lutaoense]MBB3763913.1 membrane-bound lytic murein transglycosylase A [Sphingomicrobium lutaoense]